MNNLKFVLVVALAVSTTAMASDMALYIGPPNPGWYDAAQMVTDAETIVAQTGHLFNDVQQFDDTQLDEFAEWVDARTDDGVMDIIWLNGTMPSVLYPFPNLEADGSRAEPRVRRAGDHALTAGDALPHLERGGAEGGLAFFGNHSNTGSLYEILDEDLKIVVDVTMEMLIADWKENT